MGIHRTGYMTYMLLISVSVVGQNTTGVTHRGNMLRKPCELSQPSSVGEYYKKIALSGNTREIKHNFNLYSEVKAKKFAHLCDYFVKCFVLFSPLRDPNKQILFISFNAPVYNSFTSKN